jgi:uncharacterized protein (TIGR00661 family)
MKILFGVQGTGNGHISRARKIAAHFAARGTDVTYLFSGRERSALFDMEIFGNFEHRGGVTLAQRNGELLYWATYHEWRKLRYLRDLFALDVGGYDLVISDFEPLTAWAARLHNVPSIGIGHQYAFKYPIPKCGSNLISDMTMRSFAPVDVHVGIHWQHFNCNILPPIIDTSLERDDGGERHVLVYLPFERQARVTALLRRFPEYHFVQYASDLKNGEIDNVTLRCTSLRGFRADLCRAEAVISNAGFELVAECLHTRIPILVKPVKGQMEQHSNACALQQLGWGDTLETLDEARIRNWLQSEHRVPVIRYPDVAGPLVDWILQGHWTDVAMLADSLWSRTCVPDCTPWPLMEEIPA